MDDAGSHAGSGELDLKDDTAQRNAAMEYERAAGRQPKEMEFSHAGYDIESFDPATSKTRLIEVKGLQDAWIEDAAVALSGPQYECGMHPPPDSEHWIYVVDQTQHPKPRVWPIPWTRGDLRYAFRAEDWLEFVERDPPGTAELVDEHVAAPDEMHPRTLPPVENLPRLAGASTRQFYCVLDKPALLAGMSRPDDWSPDWSALANMGFARVLCLTEQPGNYDAAPLAVAHFPLEDLCDGGPPSHPDRDAENIRLAVHAALVELTAGRGVLVHCAGGTGRTGTVLACILRALGNGADETRAHMERVNAFRGKTPPAGWPESPWQRDIVVGWC